MHFLDVNSSCILFQNVFSHTPFARIHYRKWLSRIRITQAFELLSLLADVGLSFMIRVLSGKSPPILATWRCSNREPTSQNRCLTWSGACTRIGRIPHHPFPCSASLYAVERKFGNDTPRRAAQPPPVCPCLCVSATVRWLRFQLLKASLRAMLESRFISRA